MKCFWCGSLKEKITPVEVLSKYFPERRREFCSIICVSEFLDNAPVEIRDDEYLDVRAFYTYAGKPVGISWIRYS